MYGVGCPHEDAFYFNYVGSSALCICYCNLCEFSYGIERIMMLRDQKAEDFINDINVPCDLINEKMYGLPFILHNLFDIQSGIMQ